MDVTICKKTEPITELLKKEFEEPFPDQEDWQAPIKAKLMSPAVVADFKGDQGLHLDIRRSLSKTS
jgi:hypothetical protein